ncbi:hypothetical protein D3C80_1367550 [compost metagenome]
MRLRQCVHRRLEKVVPIPSNMFGVIHRGISVEHHFAIGFPIVRIQRNANTDGDDQLIGINAERTVDCAHQRVGQRSGIIRSTDFDQQNKLVTADAGKRVLPFQR